MKESRNYFIMLSQLGYYVKIKNPTTVFSSHKNFMEFMGVRRSIFRKFVGKIKFC